MYELFSSDGFDLLIQHWMGRVQYWDEVWFNFDYRLALNPRLGFQVPDTDLWALPLNTRPPLTIFYEIDDDSMRVILHNIAAM